MSDIKRTINLFVYNIWQNHIRKLREIMSLMCTSSRVQLSIKPLLIEYLAYGGKRWFNVTRSLFEILSLDLQIEDLVSLSQPKRLKKSSPIIKPPPLQIFFWFCFLFYVFKCVQGRLTNFFGPGNVNQTGPWTANVTFTFFPTFSQLLKKSFKKSKRLS